MGNVGGDAMGDWRTSITGAVVTMTPPFRVVVMGVAGCGKSTVASALADRFEARFVEADEFHLATSIDKMANGIPLTDDDRWPWLTAVQLELTDDANVVVACSALRRTYRDLLRRAGDVRFVFLHVEQPEIERRLAGRPGHFMGEAMAASQFAALEPPEPDETDVCVVNADRPMAAVIVDAVLACKSAAVDRPNVTPVFANGVDRVPRTPNNPIPHV